MSDQISPDLRRKIEMVMTLSRGFSVAAHEVEWFTDHFYWDADPAVKTEAIPGLRWRWRYTQDVPEVKA